MQKLPEFMLVPYLGPKSPTDKVIISTKLLLHWHVYEFKTTVDRDAWLVDNEQKMREFGVAAVHLHKKYPYALLCSGALADTDVPGEKLMKVGNRACDWYAEYYLRSLALLSGSKDQSGYKAFYLCINHIEYPGQEAIIKLSYPRVFIRYNVSDAYFASFEQFYRSIATIEWLDGEKPATQAEIDQIYIDCWNYLALEERELEEFPDDDESWA